MCLFFIYMTLSESWFFGYHSSHAPINRDSTFVAVEDCDLAVLDRQMYEEVMKQHYARNLLKKVNFIKQFSFFKNFSQAKIVSILRLMRQQHFAKGVAIYRQGDPANEIYLIRSG
jgi:CRP-like cAMP-binding protein